MFSWPAKTNLIDHCVDIHAHKWDFTLVQTRIYFGADGFHVWESFKQPLCQEKKLCIKTTHHTNYPVNDWMIYMKILSKLIGKMEID